MQVNNIQSPSFQAIHVQGSKMSKIQRNVAEKLVDSISYSDAYMKAYNELIDVCFVSSKDKVVDVMFLDRESNKFIRNGRDEILRVTSKTGQKLSDISTRIQNKLEEIVNGKYVREKFNPEEAYAKNSEAMNFFEKMDENDIDMNDFMKFAIRT